MLLMEKIRVRVYNMHPASGKCHQMLALQHTTNVKSVSVLIIISFILSDEQKTHLNICKYKIKNSTASHHKPSQILPIQ